MRIDEICINMFVVNSRTFTKAKDGIDLPVNTIGIVANIQNVDDIYVEFELDNNRISAPILCHPMSLNAYDE